MLATLATVLAAAQAAALVPLVARLARGRRRPPPVPPRAVARGEGSVSVVVPARNEAHRIGPCLQGLMRQAAPLSEILVVDGGSTDGTRALVREAARRDPRVRLLDEPPRPAGAVGRPWAIAAGCERARGDWIMVVDADVVPRDGMVAGALHAARLHALGAVSFGPRIVAPGCGARWLQPSLLATLIYRFGPPSARMRA
ncbi:MAG TPA: glycosyltransferase, partial [Gemmatimonadaceae bacterium]|nr:glycosyltransferase [Gemmatimonadaceae bacterium]